MSAQDVLNLYKGKHKRKPKKVVKKYVHTNIQGILEATKFKHMDKFNIVDNDYIPEDQGDDAITWDEFMEL